MVRSSCRICTALAAVMCFCSLPAAADETRAATPASAAETSAARGAAQAARDVPLYFPTAAAWESTTAEAAGLDADSVDQALAFAVQRSSSGVVILYRGRLLAERHRPLDEASGRYRQTVHGQTADGQVVEDVASCQKSVTSVLVGIAQQKQLLSIADPVSKFLGAGWSQATAEQEAKITLRHLITMTSGLSDRLEYKTPAGSQWRYNSVAYSRALTAVGKAADIDLHELTKTWLTEPLGMQDSGWVKRRSAGRSDAAGNRLGFATTARDLARFGMLMLAQGRWQRQSVLSDAAYLRASISTSQTLNPAYGYLWWLNGTKKIKRGNRLLNGPLIATAPSDLFAAQGALGRKCYVVPGRELVVVRLGDTPDGPGRKRFDLEFWRLLLRNASR